MQRLKALYTNIKISYILKYKEKTLIKTYNKQISKIYTDDNPS